MNMREKIQAQVDKWVAEQKMDNTIVVLYGCTVHAKDIFKELQINGVELTAIVDNDPQKIGKRYLGIKVYKPGEYLLPYNKNIVVIVCSAHSVAMMNSLKELGYRDENILHIDNSVDFQDVNSLEYVRENIAHVENGYRIYESILANYSEEYMLVIAPRATGDTFIACSFLEGWVQKNNIPKYVLVGENNSVIDIAEIYGIQNVTVMGKEEMVDLLMAYTFLGNKMSIKLLADWMLRIRNSYFPDKQSEIFFADKFRYEVFGLDKSFSPCKPMFCDVIDADGYGLLRGKTVVIAPYAYSTSSAIIPISVWERLVRALIERGYRVYTVSYGSKEPPIKGTEGIRFPYKDSVGLLEYAGGFVSVRSGLCDIVSSARCKQVIIYSENIRNSNTYNFFSLNNNFQGFQGKEIFFEQYDEGEFIAYIIKYLTDGKVL